MALSTAGILVFFFCGIALHIFLRNVQPWTDQQRPWFWLTAMTLFGIGVFILPSAMDDTRFSDALNSVVAGACISEYLRVRYKDKIAKIVNFRQEVERWREHEQTQKQGKAKSRSSRRPHGSGKSDPNKPSKNQ